MADGGVSSTDTGVVGTMTHGCCVLGMHGHMKVDNRGGGQMSGHGCSDPRLLCTILDICLY